MALDVFLKNDREVVIWGGTDQIFHPGNRQGLKEKDVIPGVPAARGLLIKLKPRWLDRRGGKGVLGVRTPQRGESLPQIVKKKYRTQL